MIKVLYTDDEASLLDIAKLFLEKSGEFSVTTATSAPEAIRLLELDKFDAIISDYQMPDMDGIQFLVEVRSRFGPIPFILFTGRGREDVVIQAINSGADFYLQKGGEPKAQFAELMHKVKSAASRKRGEDALRRSEEKFRMIVENSHDIIYTLTAEGVFIFVSPAWTELLGHPVTQVVGQSFMKFVHPDDISRCLLFLKSVIETGEQQEGIEYRVLHINGVWDWHTSSAVPIKDETGTITGFYGIARDITERKRAEKALKEQLDSLAENERILQLSEKRLLMAQEIGHTGCWEYNPQTDTLWGSAETHRIFNFPPDSGIFPLDSIEACIPERERVHQALVDLICAGKEYDLEYTINPADGSAQKIIHSIARLEKDEQGNILRILGVVQDITGRKLDEEKLLKNTKELHASYAEIAASEEELRANLDELSSQEQALRESEEKLAAVVAGSPVPKFVLDSDHKIIYWNKALEQTTGISAAQVIGTRDQWRAFYPHERPTMADLILDGAFSRISGLYAGKFSESQVVEGAFEATDFFLHMGERGTYLRFMAAPIKNLQGVIIGAVETLIDVSDIKRAEVELGTKNEELGAAFEEITATEEELRANLDELTQQEQALRELKKELSDIIDFLPDATFAINTKGVVIAWNHAMEVMTGVKQADILNKGNYEYSLPFYKERRPLLIDLVLGYDEHVVEKYPGIRCEGDKLIAEVFVPHFHNGRGAHLWFTSSPLYDSQKKISGAIESIREITEHKERESALNLKNEELSAAFEEITATEEELRQQVEEIAKAQEALCESETRYREFFTISRDSVFITSPGGQWIDFNDALVEMLGYKSRVEMSKVPVPSIYANADDRSAFLHHIEQNGYVKEYPMRLKQKDGTVINTLITTVPVRYPDGTLKAFIGTIRDITRQKLEKDTLRETEQRYRNIVEDQTEFICRFLPDGTHVFVNDAYCRYFGVKREDIIGHTFSPVLFADDKKAVAAFFAALTPEKPVGTIDQRIIMPDGTIRWQRWSDRAIFDDKGNLAEYQSVGRDITEYKEVEAQLQTASKEYQNLLENITDVYYRSDAQGRLILASQSWATLLNYPELSECIGKNIARDFYANPDDRSSFLEAVYQNGYVTDYEITLKKKDGTPVTVATSSYLYFDAAGHVLGVEGTFRDISERKRITEMLKETEQRLTDIISFLPDATFVIDSEGKVIAWNHAIEELTGVPAGDMIGKGNYEYALPFYGVRRPILIDLIDTPDADLETNYSSVRRHGKILTAETGMAHVGGTNRILWGKASPLYNFRNEVVGAIESIRDFTEQRILEDSLKQVNKKLNLMSSITRHDVSNNITVCLGYLELSKYKSPNPDMQKLIAILEQNIGAIQSQINFTRVYQDLGVAAPVWQDLGELLRECSSAGKIPVIYEITNLQIYADPLISKVFYNLYDNAVRHGERVTEIHVQVQERGRERVIIWEDDGIGVLQNEKEKIFNRGFGKNTGLGLFLVREILGITGMSILENGETGKGARFEMRVPKGMWRIMGDIK